MDPYHTGRKELLQWLNESFGFGYERIEQTCTGACACQIVDSIYPGVVPMAKVNFEAKFDYEYIKNYKILQGAFTKLDVPKVIEVNKLIRGKYQDNLEFLQWLKKLYDSNIRSPSESAGYDAISKRKAAIKEYKQTTKTTIGGGGATSSQNNNTSTLSTITQRKQQNLNTSINSTTSTTIGNNKVMNVRNVNTTRGGTTRSTQIEKKIAPPKSTISMLQLRIENLERERDFYFQKLRDIELYTQAIEDNSSATPEQTTFMRDIQKILYATDEDFAVVDQNSDDEIMSENNKENLITLDINNNSEE